VVWLGELSDGDDAPKLKLLLPGGAWPNAPGGAETERHRALVGVVAGNEAAGRPVKFDMVFSSSSDFSVGSVRDAVVRRDKSREPLRLGKSVGRTRCQAYHTLLLSRHDLPPSRISATSAF
jgi:hypothetical protein